MGVNNHILPGATEMAPQAQEPNGQDEDGLSLPRAGRICGWIALLGLVILPILPRTVALTNVAGALGVITLIGIALANQGTFLKAIFPSRWLAWATLLFGLSILFSVFYPAGLELPETAALKRSLHPLWHTLRALTAAGLCLALLRRPADFAALLCLLTLTVVMVALWAPVHHWLAALSWDFRLRGVRGYPNRYATTLYLLSFPLVMLAGTPVFRRAKLPRWACWCGWGLSVLVPFLLWRKKLRVQPLDDAGWLPVLRPDRLTGHPAQMLSFYVLAGLILILGWLFWMFTRREGRGRIVIPLLGLALAIGNIALTYSRLKLCLTLVAMVAALLLMRKRSRLAIAGLALVCLAGAGLFFLHPRALNLDSMKHRFYIWDGALKVVESHWLLGVGYGTEAFQDKWQEHKPDPAAFGVQHLAPKELDTAYHAHNLWLELLAERGIFGLLAFHLLWLSALVFLMRKAGDPARADPEQAPLPPRNFAAEEGDDGGFGPIPARIAALLLGLLLIEGLFTFSLQKGNETIFYVLAALGLAAARGR